MEKDAESSPVLAVAASLDGGEEGDGGGGGRLCWCWKLPHVRWGVFNFLIG